MQFIFHGSLYQNTTEKSIDFLYIERLFVLRMDIYNLYKLAVGCYSVNHHNNLSVNIKKKIKERTSVEKFFFIDETIA